MKCVVDLGETVIENLIRLLNLCYALHSEMARFSAFEKKNYSFCIPIIFNYYGKFVLSFRDCECFVLKIFSF